MDKIKWQCLVTNVIFIVMLRIEHTTPQLNLETHQIWHTNAQEYLITKIHRLSVPRTFEIDKKWQKCYFFVILELPHAYIAILETTPQLPNDLLMSQKLPVRATLLN